MSKNCRYRLSAVSAIGLYTLILLAGLKESLSTYSTTTTTTTVSPSNLLPYFDFDVPRNLTVTVGQTGFLHCRVERLGDKDVSWIRQRDLHILTAGSTTYTSDQRFQVIRPENSGNWTLQIKYPQPRDSGVYECQINTEPKMSLSYTFNVIELKANILGPSDLYVKSGSDINLTCRILQGPHELGNIFWYKGTEIIDMATNQNELDSASRIRVENDWTDGLTSRLKIRRAMPSDTGNYTCVPTIARTASVYVHVIIGEHPAAMQGNSSSINGSNFYASVYCLLFSILTCCLQYLLVPTRAARIFSAAAAAVSPEPPPPEPAANVTTTVNGLQKETLRTSTAAAAGAEARAAGASGAGAAATKSVTIVTTKKQQPISLLRTAPATSSTLSTTNVATRNVAAAAMQHQRNIHATNAANTNISTSIRAGTNNMPGCKQIAIATR